MKGKMYKYIFSLLLLLVVLSGNSQTINGRLYTQFNNYYKWRGGAFDSVLLLPNLTATSGLRGGALRYSGSDSSLYVYTGTQWRKIDGGSGTADTTSLSNRINLKLNISDTANMLLPYLLSNVAAATYQPIGDYLVSGTHGSLQSLTITGTSGNGNIHLRHQSSLPTATGQSTTIYANSNGDFAYKNDGNYHTTFVTSANTADRSYTFQNKSYTVADNAEVVKYTDTASMLDGRISGITLNTSGAIHTTPITFNRVGGAWSGTMSLESQTANTVFAGPTTGSAATPTFRTLVDADIPSTSKGVQFTGVDSAFAYNRAKSGFSDYSEFGGMISTTVQLPNTSFNVAGTNAVNTIVGWASGVAYHQLTTHTSVTGNSRLINSHYYGLTSDWMVQNWRVQIPTLNDGTERYYIQAGIASTAGAALGFGLLFVYDLSGSMTGSAASANWQIVASNNSSRTWVTTSTAVTEGSWVTLRIVANNTAAYFYVNGVLVGTNPITTNLPVTTSSANALLPILAIFKTNGTTARTVWADYYTLDIKYATSRP